MTAQKHSRALTEKELISRSDSSHKPVYVGRFAPSPSGSMHVGNLFAFLIAYLDAAQKGGFVILRMEDLDPARTKRKWAYSLQRKLEYFGFAWKGDIVYQSERQEAYMQSLAHLKNQGLLYPCFCSRSEVHSATAPHVGDDVIYPGTCAQLSREEQFRMALTRTPAIRIRVPKKNISFVDVLQGAQSFNLSRCSGDFIVRRSDEVFSYQLAVVVDDAASKISHVVRGIDLLSSTARQKYLQELLGYPQLQYLHIPLFVDASGRRMAKRNKDASLNYVEEYLGWSAERIMGHLSFLSGIVEEARSYSLNELVKYANLEALANVRSVVWTTKSR